MTTHIMVDLETWGTAPGCDIRSIGAVVFDPIAGTLGDEFYVNVENRIIGGDPAPPGKYRCYALTRDPSTVEWWSQQSDAAQRALTIDVHDLNDGLEAFALWWKKHLDYDNEPTTFWAHGPHFDEAILAACYRATGIPVPWHYRAPRDCRTIFEAAGGRCHVDFEGVEHDALADAKNQALRVIEAYRRINGDRITELLRYNNDQVERRRAIANAARKLRDAQRAYLADRGNEGLGAAVASAAGELDSALDVHA